MDNTNLCAVGNQILISQLTCCRDVEKQTWGHSLKLLHFISRYLKNPVVSKTTETIVSQ